MTVPPWPPGRPPSCERPDLTPLSTPRLAEQLGIAWYPAPGLLLNPIADGAAAAHSRLRPPIPLRAALLSPDARSPVHYPAKIKNKARASPKARPMAKATSLTGMASPAASGSSSTARPPNQGQPAQQPAPDAAAAVPFVEAALALLSTLAAIIVLFVFERPLRAAQVCVWSTGVEWWVGEEAAPGRLGPACTVGAATRARVTPTPLLPALTLLAGGVSPCALPSSTYLPC